MSLWSVVGWKAGCNVIDWTRINWNGSGSSSLPNFHSPPLMRISDGRILWTNRYMYYIYILGCQVIYQLSANKRDWGLPSNTMRCGYNKIIVDNGTTADEGFGRFFQDHCLPWEFTENGIDGSVTAQLICLENVFNSKLVANNLPQWQTLTVSLVAHTPSDGLGVYCCVVNGNCCWLTGCGNVCIWENCGICGWLKKDCVGSDWRCTCRWTIGCWGCRCFCSSLTSCWINGCVVTG